MKFRVRSIYTGVNWARGKHQDGSSFIDKIVKLESIHGSGGNLTLRFDDPDGSEFTSDSIFDVDIHPVNRVE